MSAVQLARQDGGELVGEGLVAGNDPVGIGAELVVEHHRRDRGEKAKARGQKRLGNAGGHDREVGILRFSDFDEGVHDAPDRAKKADERRRGTNSRQNRQALLKVPRFLGDGDVHRAVDPPLRAGDQIAIVTVAAPPFEHTGGKDLFALPFGRGANLVEERVQRLARPEGVIKNVRLGAGLSVLPVLVDHHGPAPDRCGDQHQHHQFDQKRRAGKERPHRVVGCYVHLPARSCGRFGLFGPIYRISKHKANRACMGRQRVADHLVGS